MIDFGTGPRLAVTIPWGDVATAYFTTGIANIEVYVPASPRSIARLRRLDRLRPLLRMPIVRALAGGMAARRNPGPSQKERESEKTWVWGEVAQRPRRRARRASYDQQRLSPHRRRRADGGPRASRPRARRRLFHAVATAGRALRRAAARLQRYRDRVSSALTRRGNPAAGLRRARRWRCSTSGCAARASTAGASSSALPAHRAGSPAPARCGRAPTSGSSRRCRGTAAPRCASTAE